MKIKILSFIFAAFAFASCSLVDVANELPPHALVPENVIFDESSADKLLLGVYSEFRTWGFNEALVWAPGCAAGFFKEGVRDNMSFRGEGSFMGNDIRESTQQSEYFWKSFYKTINYVNYFEKALGNVGTDIVPEKRREEMLGEARFMRAHTYLYVLTYYGYFWDVSSEYGAILRLSPSTTDNIAMARSSVKDTYDAIIKDLEYAAEHAPAYNIERNFRGSKLAAKAMLARVLLMKGDYTAAAAMAQEVINNSSGVQLESSYADCFSKNLNSKELIFGRKLDEEAKRYDDQEWIFKNAGLVLSDMAYDMLKDDPRYSTIADSAFAEDYYTGETKFYGMKTLKTWNSSADFGTRFIRLGEMYLIKAEALVRAHGDVQEALNALNTIRERGGVTTPVQVTNEEALLDIILKEIFTELSFENGLEWLAMVRFNKVSAYKPIDNANRWVCALPASEMSYNFLANQNPYYIK